MRRRHLCAWHSVGASVKDAWECVELSASWGLKVRYSRTSTCASVHDAWERVEHTKMHLIGRYPRHSKAIMSASVQDACECVPTCAYRVERPFLILSS